MRSSHAIWSLTLRWFLVRWLAFRSPWLPSGFDHVTWLTCTQLSYMSLSLPKPFPCADDVFKWKHFPRYWPFLRGIHRSPVNSPHKGQWRGALMFSLFCVWINGWVNNGEAGDLRRCRAHYDVIVMVSSICTAITHRRSPNISCRIVVGY